ncbi:MAG TPA: RodZ domain-containing protein [Noviherbaspirillum sp.]|uniref:helix-turn-helix domain-containing protein n=1 Tax=Noviherbaspirillum sp. TaxID=1926288 RepID=UPI002B490710|nr:RodZ domain-containing protein [Noviherbaspirillum sp.]HJV85776.1 RodZ domain-containing protein [Noviherbaspirillum sp.]
MASPGAQLAACRKERGWTVEQVASQLNLAPRQIVAIESDDYPALPGMPIVRGFIRAYAKLLKIDPAPLLATLGGETVMMNEPIAPRKTLSTPFSERRLPVMGERPGLSSKWIVGLLLLVLAAVAIWATQIGGDWFSPTKLEPSAAKPGTEAPLPNAGAPAQKPAEAELPQAASPAAPAPGATPESAVQAASPANTASPAQPETAKPDAAVAPAGTATTPATATTGKDALQLKVNEDSWVQVRRAGDNKVLLSRVVKAGETETVDVTEPITVVIGNASGVEANLRGTPLTLKAGRGNVARLNLK